MSRCFTYPPPGYVCNRTTGDALIESIKIGKEKEKIKQEKKEQKRVKTEQKKKEREGKKKKEKERLNSSIQTTDGNHKRKQCCDGFEKSSFVNSKHVDQQKKIEPEAEQLERSSLTEEYGQPIVMESLGYSSDGTQSHTKKCKIEQPPTNGNCTTQGKVIRFRLKKREPKNDHPADNIPSTSGRTEDIVPTVVDDRPLNDTEYVNTKANEQPVSNILPSVRQDSGTLLTNNLPTKKLSKPESAYDSLFIEWVPPPIHFNSMEINDDDESWLLPSKKRTAQDRASLNAYDGLSGRHGISFQPRVHLLPELDIYVLPYIVPF